MSLTRFLQIARPRPLPPKRREMDASICENGLKRRCIFSGAMPMPVSLTETWRREASTEILVADASIQIEPRIVNLRALLTRLRMIWRKRAESPTAMLGTDLSIFASMERERWTALLFRRKTQKYWA